jgi:hypothetical protein
MKLSRITFCLLVVFVFPVTTSAHSKSKNTTTKITKGISDIRKVDFKNFNYGLVCTGYHKFLPTEPRDRLVLRKGHIQFDEINYANLGSVKYVDFDEDGKEEAFVVINGQTSGSSNRFLIAYVFAYRNGKAQQIWTKCEENSAAELKGRAIHFTYPEWVDDDAHCCPSYFTTDTYGWRGSGFARISKKRKKND